MDCIQCQRHFPLSETDRSCPSEPPTPAIRSLTTMSDLARRQKADPDINPVYVALQQRTNVTEETYKLLSGKTRRLFEMIDVLRLADDGRLVASLPVGKDQRRRDVAVCPKDLTGEIIAQKHSQAHLRTCKAMSRIHLDWYWPGMSGEVRR